MAILLFAFAIPLDWFIKILIAIFLGCLSGGFYFYIKKYSQSVLGDLSSDEDIKENLKEFAKTVFYTLKELGQLEKAVSEANICILKREGGTYRIFLDNSKLSRNFTLAVAEILSPIQNQKYIIERKRYKVPHQLKELWEEVMDYSLENYHPVPEIFGINRKTALVFQKYWNTFISPGK
jgi:hypothetical protein